MLVNELGSFCAQVLHDMLGGALREAVKARILDTLGCGLAAAHANAHRTLLQVLGEPGDATVWGCGRGLPLRDALLVNSFLGHATYLDDGSRFSGAHPGAVVVPAVLGLAERERKGGRDVIAATAAGYEVLLRVGQAIYPSAVTRGFQSTAILGAIGAAAACANLLRLDAVATKNAIAIAANLGVGLKEALKASESQPLQVARSSEGGLLAALYAQAGGTGADSMLEKGFLRAFADGADATRVLSGLGTEWRVFETYIKLHGGCRGNHAPLDVVRDLVQRHGVRVREIERMRIYVNSVSYAGEIHDPRNGDQAQFSVPFAVSVALLNGDASNAQYTDEQLARPEVRALMARIDVTADAALDREYPDKHGARAEVVLADGRTLAGAIDNARGEPEYPLPTDEVADKFMHLACPLLRDDAGRVRDLVLALEANDDLAGLMRLLRGAGPAA